MIKSWSLRLLVFSLVISFMSSCLKTRAQVEQQEQTRQQGQKLAQNQADAQAEPSEPPPPDEKELLRQTMGKVEVLEAEVAQLKSALQTQGQNHDIDPEKFKLMQEVVIKLEAKMSAIEAERQAIAAREQAKAAVVEESAAQARLNSYQLAEAHFKNKDWKKAILSYQKYSEESPKGKFVADAKYKIGVSFQELGLKDEAIAFYEEVIAQFPNTETGKKARYRLSQIKKK